MLVSEKEIVLEVKNLTVNFGKGKHKFTAIDDVSFHIFKGETFGLVGESGSGKTTIGRSIMRINEVTEGQILYHGKTIHGKIPKDWDREITQKIQMIFQDPMASLNERAKVDYIVAEGLYPSKKYKDEAERQEKVLRALINVGLLPEFSNRFPHEFSGGQRQRVGIARALSLRPRLLICDEPVSALDPIGRREVLNLIQEIKHETTILLSTHILGDAEEICERFVIMKQGEKIMDTTIDKLLTHNSEEVVHLEIASENMLSVQIIEKLPYVKHVEANGKRMKVTLENVQENKDMLMRDTLENKLDIVRFEVGSSETLEDIFLKMVVSV